MTQFELSEEFIDHLIVKYEHWIMEHGELNPVIQEFINWCKKEEYTAMRVKRSQDGKSYLERHVEHVTALAKSSQDRKLYIERYLEEDREKNLHT